MTFYSGQNGRMQIRTSTNPDTYETLAKVTTWSISSSQTPLDCTSLEQTDKTYVNGLRNTTGSCRIFYYDDTSGSTRTNSAKTLIDKIVKARKAGAVAGVADEPETVFLKLQVVEGTATTREIEVEALITTAAMQMAVGQVLAADIQFQVNGAPKTVTL